MNKKGLTLVELLAVIAIVGFLAVMITPSIIAMRENVLENTLESKKKFILNAAKEYANENLYLMKNYICDGIDNSIDCLDSSGNRINEIVCNGYNVNDTSGTTGQSCRGIDEVLADSYEKKEYVSCTTVSVNGLINMGYISTTTSHLNESRQIINPVTNESMNNEYICIRFTDNNAMTRQLIAFFIDRGVNTNED